MVCPTGGRCQHGVHTVVLHGKPVGGGRAGGVAADLACQCMARFDWKTSWQDACCIMSQRRRKGTTPRLGARPNVPLGQVTILHVIAYISHTLLQHTARLRNQGYSVHQPSQLCTTVSVKELQTSDAAVRFRDVAVIKTGHAQHYY